MMKFIPIGVVVLGLSTQALQACETVDSARMQAVKNVILTSEGTNAANIALYLSDDFYIDLTCRLSNLENFRATRTADITPQLLAQSIEVIMYERNQSDALMMILTAMQSASSGEKGS